jgi:hypothetical protein
MCRVNVKCVQASLRSRVIASRQLVMHSLLRLTVRAPN